MNNSDDGTRLVSDQMFVANTGTGGVGSVME